MQRAAEGVEPAELMKNLDSNLRYGGARRISDYEAELLDEIDENFDAQIKLQKNLITAQKSIESAQKKMRETEDAINEYCTETTRDKILLARGWQFQPERTEEISTSLSDKEEIHRLTMRLAVSNAISKGVTSKDLADAESVEKSEKLTQKDEAREAN